MSERSEARSAVPAAIQLLLEFQLNGTWNVPTTWTFFVCVTSSLAKVSH